MVGLCPIVRWFVLWMPHKEKRREKDSEVERERERDRAG